MTRAVNAGCGFACTVHSNSARDALTAIVNAAIMAGENVTEGIVRRVFANSIDFVVHLDRDMRRHDDADHGIRRQVREILAVTRSLSSDDFTTEPIFVRLAIWVSPCDGRGAIRLRIWLIGSTVPAHGRLRQANSPWRLEPGPMRLLAALATAVFVYLAIGFPHRERPGDGNTGQTGRGSLPASPGSSRRGPI